MMENCSPDACGKPLKAAEWSFCLCPGRSLTVDVWSPSLRGLSGRLISYSQSPRSTESCLSFFYKLYGPNAGKNKRAAQGGDSHKTRGTSPNMYRITVLKWPLSSNLIQVLWMWSWQTRWILRSFCGPAVEHTVTFGMKHTAQCRPRLQTFR